MPSSGTDDGKQVKALGVMSKLATVRTKFLHKQVNNIKIIYVPYTNKQKSQIGEFGTKPPVAVG